MRFVNEVTHEPIVADGALTATGVVQRRGVSSTIGPQRWAFERRTPVAVLVDSPSGNRRIDVPRQTQNPLPVLVPVIGYFIVRAFVKRRTRR